MALTLPRPTEGFYLPAIEAMASGAIVVCPDCVGNRDFCHDGVNCFRPAYDEGEIIAAVQRAIRLSAAEAVDMRRQADVTVADHSLERERASFLQVLDRVDELWNE
jgi:glycosyltransferase involved in cell wall biosynthesis